jgi:hypothetical protein
MAEQLELFPQEELQQQEAGSIESIETKPIADAEWCFQFFNNEPIVFGWQDEGAISSPITFKIEPVEGEALLFKQNGMEFKIFPRPIGEETKKERKNASKNKEA